MVAFKSLDRLTPEMIEQLISGQKEIQLYEITYLAAIRPNRRDVTEQGIIVVTARVWAVDADDARGQLEANIPHAEIEGVDTQLTPIYVTQIRMHDIGIESMLEISDDPLKVAKIAGHESN